MRAKNIGKKVDADVGKALANIGSMRPDIKADDTELKAAVAPKKAQSFGEAFKAARAAGDKTFTWGGKSYAAKMAGEGASKPTAKAAAPKAAAPTAATTSPTNTRAQMEMRRTATRSQAAIREKRAENQADFRKRMQAKRAGESTGTTSAGPRDNSAAGRRARMGKVFSALNPFSYLPENKDFEESQKKKYGYKKGGSVDGCAIRGKTRAPLKKGK